MGVLKQSESQPMQTLNFDTTKITYMEIIEKELYNALDDSKGVIREMCSHILNAGGKRIRPLLVLYSGLVFSPVTNELVCAAVASELIHMASLVHDDIIDNSNLRRKKPSINKIWGNQFAVLCGDYLFAKAFSVLADYRLIKSLDLMVDAIQNMCSGEIQQANDKFNSSVTMEVYYQRIARKTAIFLQSCCRSGASIAGSDDESIKILGEYGLNMGLAFQIIDDILDFCGNTDVMGKPKREDLSQGNITLPVILMLQDERHKKWIKELIDHEALDSSQLDAVSNVLREAGYISKSFDIALSHIKKSRQCLELLPQSEHTRFLDNLAVTLQARAN